MAERGALPELSPAELRRVATNPVQCPLAAIHVESVADYLAVLDGLLSEQSVFWYRGHADVRWDLVPSALRFSAMGDRRTAVQLVTEFKRVAEMRIVRPPARSSHLEWLQIAQHYGLPTRLLDWTRSATVGLYFACLRPETDGLVFLMNPEHLNAGTGSPRVANYEGDQALLDEMIRKAPQDRPKGRPAVAVDPTWNSERLMMQKGVFTLHGTKFAIRSADVPSLIAIPILREWKAGMIFELERIGTDRMSLFPELEYACQHLARNLMMP